MCACMHACKRVWMDECMHACMRVWMDIYIGLEMDLREMYVCVYIERERQRDIYICCVYIYVYMFDRHNSLKTTAITRLFLEPCTR